MSDKNVKCDYCKGSDILSIFCINGKKIFTICARCQKKAFDKMLKKRVKKKVKYIMLLTGSTNVAIIIGISTPIHILNPHISGIFR